MDRQYWKVLKLQIANKCTKVCKKDQALVGKGSCFAYLCNKYLNELLYFQAYFLRLYKCERILFTHYIFCCDHILGTQKKVVSVFNTIFIETNTIITQDIHIIQVVIFEIMLIKVKVKFPS